MDEFGFDFDNGEAFMQSEPENMFEEPEYNQENIDEKGGVLNFGSKGTTNNEEKVETSVDAESEDLFNKASVTTYKKENNAKNTSATNFTAPTIEQAEQKIEQNAEQINNSVPEFVNINIENAINTEDTTENINTESTENVETKNNSSTNYVFDDFNVEDLTNRKKDDRINTCNKVEQEVDEAYFTNKFNDKSTFEEVERQNEQAKYDEFIDENINTIYEDENIEVIAPNKDNINPDIDNSLYKTYKPPIRLSMGVKKVIAFAAMVVILIGIPLIVSIINKVDNNTEKTKVYDSEYKNTTEYNNKPETTKTNNSNSGDDLYNEIARANNELFKGNNYDNSNKSRFSSFDELSAYIDENTNNLYSKEIKIVNAYKQRNISKEIFFEEMNSCIEEVNTLNHLLLVNKQGYENNGKTLDYNTLSSNLETLTVYGDLGVYNAKQE